MSWYVKKTSHGQMNENSSIKFRVNKQTDNAHIPSPFHTHTHNENARESKLIYLNKRKQI